MPIQREPLDSSMLASAGYDAGGRIMEVEFKTNGAVYRVEGVDPRVFEGLMGAESAGQYYNTFIKGQYPVVKIG